MNFVDQKKIIREDFLLKREKLKENFTNKNKNELILNLNKFVIFNKRQGCINALLLKIF